MIALRQQKKFEEKEKRVLEDSHGSEEHFYFIVGYTSDGGFSYGITSEEAKELKF